MKSVWNVVAYSAPLVSENISEENDALVAAALKTGIKKGIQFEL